MRRLAGFILCLALLLAVPFAGASGAGLTDAWGYTDEDGDGLILVPVGGKTFTGHLLIVLDPTRVAVACRPDRFYSKGYTVADFAESFGAVAAVNGGGFEDFDGNGDGSTPETFVVTGGEMYAGWLGAGNGFAGLDADGWLQVGLSNSVEVTEKNIVEGVGYGPVLIADGKTCDPGQSAFAYWVGLLNPRTVIAQRQDGAILFLLAEGREPNCLGASFADCTELLLSFGAISACNLDGGNSSQMWLKGKYLNNPAGTFGIRPIPTCYIVKQSGSGAWSAPVIPDAERRGLTKEEREAQTPGGEASDPAVDDGTRREITSLAKDFVSRYLTFSADLGGLSYPNYNALLKLVVPNGALQRHLHGAFGSFGYWSISSCTLDKCNVASLQKLPNARYQAVVHYTTTTVGTKGVPATEEKNLALTVVREGEQFLVEDMLFF